MTADRVTEVLRELLAARGVALTAETLAQSPAQLGLDSLHVVELQLELEQALGVELAEGGSIEQAFHTMPLAEFLAHVARRVQSRAT